MTQQQKIFIVSNRLPISISVSPQGDVSAKRSSGGLVTALRPVHTLPTCHWMGYAGNPTDNPQILNLLKDERLIPVFLKKGLYNAFYNGASNDGIWPLFHYFPTLADFSGREWKAYRWVNRLFRDELLKHVSPNDVVWIHDYHLMLLPGMLREAEPSLRIGYFHHIPFPTSEVVRVHPARLKILRGLLGADLVGFHTMEYARHFISTAYRLLGSEGHGDDVHLDDRIIKVGAFPLGIDVEGFDKALKSEKHATQLDSFLDSYRDKMVVLGVDRLDYTKGIPQRLKAIGHFLSENPDLRDKVVFVLICVPSRVDISKYGNLREQVERLVGQVNGEFGSPTHMPIHYLFRSVDVDTLTALYRRADVCLTTPLRDGLNLVCKEYVACHPDGNGALILSEFAGAAEEMGEAIIVNPYDIGGTANAIAAALRMTPDEKRRRMLPLYRRIMESDNQTWAKSFIEVLNDAVAQRISSQSRVVDREVFMEIMEQVRRASSTLVCVDFDALVHSARQSVNREELIQRLMNQLEAAGRWKNGMVILLSGQSVDVCTTTFANLHVWVVAEYGAFVRHPETLAWSPLLPVADPTQAYEEAITTLQAQARRVPRSFVDRRQSTTLWDISQTRSNFAVALAREMAHSLDTMLAHEPTFCRLTRSGLELRNTNINFGLAAEAMAERCEIDDNAIVITLGDSRTDEKLFQVLPQKNISINIGTRSRVARHSIRDSERLSSFLQMFIKASETEKEHTP